jgi:pimeloyl-ACP methyl ester carboxylesterase
MWIGAWAWREITADLRAAGHDVYPLTLTGVADRSHLLGPDVDLDTHVADIVRLIEVEDLHDVVLVGHSYGGLPVSTAAARMRDRIKTVVYVDSGPLPIGTSQMMVLGDTAASAGDAVLPPPWDPATEPTLLAGLDDRALALLRGRSTAHPLASVTQPVTERATSADVPTVLIACTFPMDQIEQMMAAGHPFFAGLTQARIIPIDTGHWPMLSQPKALTAALTEM